MLHQKTGHEETKPSSSESSTYFSWPKKEKNITNITPI